MALFRTTMFPSEAEAIAKDEYLKEGKYLAKWIASRLSENGISVGDVGSEDWGWYIELTGEFGLVQVCCSKVDDTDDQWLVHTHETTGIGKWFNRSKGKAGMEPEVIKALAAILRADQRVRNAGWIEESGKNWNELSSDPFAPPGKNDVAAD